MRKNEEYKTKKVYHAKHASAKAHKRDRKSNKINPLDYVGSEDLSFIKGEG